jgi:hypothetical protein
MEVRRAALSGEAPAADDDRDDPGVEVRPMGYATPRNDVAGHRALLAQACCLSLGIALLLWSLAPAVVERILSNAPPSPQTIVLGSVTFFVGAVFLALYAFIRRGLRWALWAAFLGGLSIATAGVAAAIASPTSMPALFSLVLAGATATTAWLALDASRTRRTRAE